jgi:Glycosyltransferase family 87
MNRTPDAMESAQPGGRVNPWRVVAAISMLMVGVCILAFAMSASDAANLDFISYWAAGQQLVHHGNPYDGDAILGIERASGYLNGRPFFMRNPPSAFFLALPLGFVGVRVGVVLWSLALVASLMASIRMLWILHGRPPDRLHLVGYCFPPTLACLLSGQIGMFLLLGVVLFLYFHHSKPYFAGAALILCALKPHLFLPFGVVLIAWIVMHKAYRILAGTLGAMIASVVLSFFLDPAGWSDYARMMKAASIQDEFVPTISLVFRLVVHRDSAWLQFGPAFAGCIWGLWYFWTRRERWNWLDHGSLLLINSILVAPYAWLTDQVVVIPALLQAVYLTRSRVAIAILAIATVVEEIVVCRGAPLMHSAIEVWTVPVWLAWYLYAVRSKADQRITAYDPTPLAEDGKAIL